MAKATRKLDLSTSEKELPPPAPTQLKKAVKPGQQCGHMCPPATTSALNGSALRDGLRILMLQEGRFWPARIGTTQLPDVYEVRLENQRGKGEILPRDDILSEAVSSNIIINKQKRFRSVISVSPPACLRKLTQF